MYFGGNIPFLCYDVTMTSVNSDASFAHLKISRQWNSIGDFSQRSQVCLYSDREKSKF